MDMETIDQARFEKLPIHVKPRTYHLGDPGSGCYLAPPGHPSHAVQSVYTQYGNEPRRGAIMVLHGRVVQTADEPHERYAARLERLFTPLPWSDERVQAWVADVYRHFAHCYLDEQGDVEPPQYGRPSFVIWPVPGYKLERFHDDPRFSDEWRAAEIARIDAANADLIERTARIATPENHMAHRHIRRWYPDAPFMTELA